MKSIILFFRAPEPEEIGYILERYQPAEVRLLWNAPLGPRPEFSEFDQEVLPVDHELQVRLKKEILQKLLNFGDHRDPSGFSIAQHLNYQDMNLWYYNKFRTYYDFQNYAYKSEVIRSVIRGNEDVLVFNDNNLFGLVDDLPQVTFSWTARGNRKVPGVPFRYLINAALRVLLNPMFSHNPTNKYLVLSPGERLTRMLDPKTLDSYVEDPFFGYMIRKFPNEFIVLDEMTIPKKGQKSPGGWTFLHVKSRKTRVLGEAVMMKGLFSGRVRKRWKMINRKYDRVFEKLLDHETGFNRSVLLYLNQFRSSFRYFTFRYLSFRQYFSRYKIRAVVAVDENSPFTKVVLDAAKANSIRTIGVQHGNIHELHAAYMFSEKDWRLHPAPDHTLSWGESWKKVMVESGHYPEDRILITGQLRTDVIPALIREQSNRPFTLVFASQPQRDENARKKAAVDVFRLAAQIPEIRVRLKMHPREQDQKYYLDIAKEAGLSKLEIVGDEDLYQVIAGCDALITCFSTVGSEAVYFRKPLILMDYQREDINGYFREGVAFQAASFEELSEQVRGLKEGTLKIDAASYEEYIRNYAHAIDGKVANRMMEAIRVIPPRI